MKKFWDKYAACIIMLTVFEAIAIFLWRMLDNLFYLFNFSYIGVCLSLGLYLYSRKHRYARHAVQFMVGGYMLIYLGILCGENMQIEGFWYYLFLGAFEAATIHYAIAKLFGPLIFGRGWCGYACWTAMILDLLPYKTSPGRRKRLGIMRYIVFGMSLIFVAGLFLLQIPNMPQIMFVSFIVGNLIYYALGIGLALKLRDNRAFCKYLCPVTVFLKPASYWARFRVTVDREKCISCGQCHRVCPMDVDMTDNVRGRLNGTECILCLHCVDACPRQALKL